MAGNGEIRVVCTALKTRMTADPELEAQATLYLPLFAPSHQHIVTMSAPSTDSPPSIESISDGLAKSFPHHGTTTVHRPAIDAVKGLLNEPLRIRTSDGRMFVGTFVCMDKQLNIVLTNTDEHRVMPGATAKVNERGRYVTMVMVPWRLVVKVEATNPDAVKKTGLRSRISGYSIEEEDMEFT